MHAGNLVERSREKATPLCLGFEFISAMRTFSYLQNIWSRGSWFCSTYKRQERKEHTMRVNKQRLDVSKHITLVTTRTLVCVRAETDDRVLQCVLSHKLSPSVSVFQRCSLNFLGEQDTNSEKTTTQTIDPHHNQPQS